MWHLVLFVLELVASSLVRQTHGGAQFSERTITSSGLRCVMLSLPSPLTLIPSVVCGWVCVCV